MADLITELRQCGLFRSLSVLDASRLARHARTRDYARNAVIYAPSDPGNCVMVLVRGRVKIKVPGAARVDGAHAGDGARETVLAFIGEGDTFGELALLDGKPRRDCAEAVEDSQVLIVPRPALLGLVEGHPDLALAIARLIGQRRQRIEARLADLLFSSSRERMVRILLELAETHGERSGDRVEIRLPLSHQDVAGLIGVSRETATIALGELHAAGFVEMSRLRIAITDLPRLRREAVGTPIGPPLGPAGDAIRTDFPG